MFFFCSVQQLHQAEAPPLFVTHLPNRLITLASQAPAKVIQKVGKLFCNLKLQSQLAFVVMVGKKLNGIFAISRLVSFMGNPVSSGVQRWRRGEKTFAPIVIKMQERCQHMDWNAGWYQCGGTLTSGVRLLAGTRSDAETVANRAIKFLPVDYYDFVIKSGRCLNHFLIAGVQFYE